MQSALRRLQTFIVNVLLEDVRTSRLDDISPEEFGRVIDVFIGYADDGIEITEKLAGQHLTVVVTEDGEIFTTTKKMSRRKTSEHIFPEVTRVIEDLHPPVGKKKVYRFEVIRPQGRPDYVAYATDGDTVVVEYSGAMSQTTADALNKNDIGTQFMTKSDIIYKRPKLSATDRKKLERLKDDVLSGDKKAASRAANVLSIAVERGFFSALGGGPIEGLFARFKGKRFGFKIPSKAYTDLQRVQISIYSTFMNMSQKNVQKRLRAAAHAQNLTNDRLIVSIVKYVEWLDENVDTLQKGLRTFFGPDELDELWDMLDAMEEGDIQAAKDLYATFYERIQDRDAWHVV